MLVWMTLGAAFAADVACGPGPAEGPRVLRLRGHRYRRIGQCRGVPVYRTSSTDSTFADRAAAPGPVILVTRESVSPDSDGGDWPAPRGNLYLSLVVGLERDDAQAALAQAVRAELHHHAPDLATQSSWDGRYGAHRASDGRFVAGLLSESRPEGTSLGLDLHVHARASAYARFGAEADHVSLAALGYAPPCIDAVLWSLLRRLPPPVR
ncbi:MAG: hypothetical protein VX265_06575 [Myxococcota bacterium]|nr:hypothetical protein [Myxococcota bacterium]